MTAGLVVIGAALTFLLAEALSPRAGQRPKKGLRWLSNAGLGVIAYGMGKVLFGAGIIGLAAWAQARGIGAFNMTALPLWAEIALSIAVLDFALWAQHAAFHMVPWLWPLHRVHHSDEALDVTSAWRFHPMEIMLSLGVKAAAVLALGAPAVAVAIFEVLLVVSAMFNHAHMRLPLWLDRMLSVLIVTPDMHRVHHGISGKLDRTNYGFFLNLWDRLFATYKRLPAQQTDALPLGSDAVMPSHTLLRLLRQPFGGDPRRH